MQTTKTMRVASSRECAWDGTGAPTQVEMTLADETGNGMPAMSSDRLTVAIADQRPIGTKYTVDTTYTEITA